jgi:hypothetical protein
MPRGSVDGWVARLSREYEEQAILKIKVPARECETQKSSLSTQRDCCVTEPARRRCRHRLLFSSRRIIGQSCAQQRQGIRVRLLPTLCG